MSNSKERFWSDNTPKIPHRLYLQEKAHFAGAYIASIQYGTYEASPIALPIHTRAIWFF